MCNQRSSILTPQSYSRIRKIELSNLLLHLFCRTNDSTVFFFKNFKKKIMRSKFIFSLFAGALLFTQCQNPTAPKPVTTGTNAVEAVASGLSSAKVVYVDLDSLQEKYAWFKDTKVSFEQRERALASSIDAKAQDLQRQMATLNEKAQKGITPPAQLQQEGQSLQRRQQELVGERDKKSKELVDESQQFNATLQKRVQTVLGQLQQQKGYDYVMSYSKGGGGTLLYVNNKLDVTKEVLALLNALPK